MKRWHKPITLCILVVVVLLLISGVIVYLNATSEPEVARLLPNADGIVYLNLTPLRLMTNLGRHPVTPSPEYQKFIDATGIVFERDLDQAAFALTTMANPNGPNGAIAYSEVFVGHFNSLRLTTYLASLASSEQSYRGKTIYLISNQGRTDRVVVLSRDLVAVSNTPSEDAIHTIVDHYREPFWARTKPALLASYYKEVPTLSLAWGIGRAKLLLGAKDAERLAWLNHLVGSQLLISPDTPLIASLRWTGKAQLRLEEIAANPDEAAASAMALRAGLRLAKLFEGLSSHSGQAANFYTVLDSAQVKQQGNRTILTASAPQKVLEQIFAPHQQPETMPQP